MKLEKCTQNYRCIYRITKSGSYESKIINGELEKKRPEVIGKQRGYYWGLEIHTDFKKGEKVFIPELTISNVNIGLIKKGDGIVEIGKLTISNCGADSINIKGSNLTINNLKVSKDKPTLPYKGIKTTDKLAFTEIQKILKDCGEDLEIKYLKDLRWIESFIPNPRNKKVMIKEKVKVDGKMKQVFISSNFDHSDVGFQAYYQDFSKKQKERNNSELFLSQGQIESAFSAVYGGVDQQRNTQKQVQNSLYEALEEHSYKLNSIDFSKRIPKELRSIPIQIDDFKFDIRLSDSVITRTLVKKQNKCKKGQSSKIHDGEVKNITIKNIDVDTKNRTSQIFILSESSHYSDFNIGIESLKIKCAYSYWFFANTLIDSTIGNKKSQLDIVKTKPAKLLSKMFKYSNGKDKVYVSYDPPKIDHVDYPLVKIGSGLDSVAPCTKKTFHGHSTTKGVVLRGVALKKDLVGLLPTGKVGNVERVKIENERNPSTLNK